MEMSEILEIKNTTELEILKSITAFSAKTGLEVDRVVFDKERVIQFGKGKTSKILYWFKLKIEI